MNIVAQFFKSLIGGDNSSESISLIEQQMLRTLNNKGLYIKNQLPNMVLYILSTTRKK